MGEVRKLQKKLRQIENLEIKVSLTPEEKIKVQNYDSILSLIYAHWTNPKYRGLIKLLQVEYKLVCIFRAWFI